MTPTINHHLTHPQGGKGGQGQCGEVKLRDGMSGDRGGHWGLLPPFVRAGDHTYGNGEAGNNNSNPGNSPCSTFGTCNVGNHYCICLYHLQCGRARGLLNSPETLGKDKKPSVTVKYA